MATTTSKATVTILANGFHGTEYRTRASEARLDRLRMAYPDELSPADRALRRRIRRALCGVEGCTCATTGLGER